MRPNVFGLMLARTHQNLIWTRQRQTNQLRSTLREFYPAALVKFEDLAGPDALAVLAVAPTPPLGPAAGLKEPKGGDESWPAAVVFAAMRCSSARAG